MEPLIFAIVACRKGYHQMETFVPEPKFLPFDLRSVQAIVRRRGAIEASDTRALPTGFGTVQISPEEA